MRKSILSQCRPLGPPGRFGARPDHPHLPDGLKLPETTPEERAVLSAHIARRKQKRPSPRVELIEKAGSVELSTDHPIPPLGNALIMESTWHCGLRFLRRIAHPAGQCRSLLVAMATGSTPARPRTASCGSRTRNSSATALLIGCPVIRS